MNVSRVGGKNAGASVFARDNYFSSNEKVTGKGECIRIRIEYLVLHFAQPYQLEQQHSDVAAVALRTHNQRPSQRNHLRDSMQKSVRDTQSKTSSERLCKRQHAKKCQRDTQSKTLSERLCKRQHADNEPERESENEHENRSWS